MRTLLAAALAALVATSSGAAVKTCGQGAQTLTPAAITTAGPTPSADILNARAAPAVAFQAVTAAGTATVRIEICCTGPCDVGGTWAPVEGSDMSLTAGTPSLAKGVANPACLYRANVTVCSGCSVTVPYGCTGP